jgi:hypothetical protein
MQKVLTCFMSISQFYTHLHKCHKMNYNSWQDEVIIFCRDKESLGPIFCIAKSSQTSLVSLLPCFNYTITTEWRGRVVNKHSCFVFGRSRVHILARTPATLRFSRFSSVTPGECRDSTLKFGHDRFHTKPFRHSLMTISFDAVYS